MSSAADSLEQSYRRFTRLFPRQYRDSREDEMLSVLLENAAPEQSRATTADAADLLSSAAKLWFLYAIGSDRSSRQAAAGVLAVLLPTVFLYGAGMSVRVITVLPPDAVLGYMRHDQSWAAWLSWAMVTVLLVLRMSRSARGMAVLATLLYVGSMGYTLWRLGPNPFVHSAAWLMAQVVAAWLLFSPRRVELGYALASKWWQLGVGILAFAVGFTHDWWWAAGQGASALWVAAIFAFVMAALLLRTAAGRVIVPVMGALIAFAVATRLWANNIRWYDHSGLAWLRITDLLLLVAVPLLTLVALRLFTVLLDRAMSPSPRAHQ
jgi:hypothetical protein